MYFSKDSNFLRPFKTPYARPNNEKLDPTVSKIISKPRTLENNCERSRVPVKSISFNYSHANGVQTCQNYVESSSTTSYANENTYNYSGDVCGITTTSCYAENRNCPQTVHFRPRKSQLGSRFENTYDHSTEMKLMNIADPVEVSEKSNYSNFKTNPEISPKGFQIKSRHNLMRVFTGSVENILQWARLKNSFQILFEVTAIVDFTQPGKWKTEKKFCLRDSNSGFKLQVVYHEIDRPLETLAPDSLVTCTGRLLMRNHFQAYKVEHCTEDKKNDLKRLSFICNRVADELVAAEKKKNENAKSVKNSR